MTSLEHIHIKPVVVVEPLGRTAIRDAVGLGMESHQAILFSNSFRNSCRHRAPDGDRLFVLGIAVTAYNPDDVLLIFVSRSDPFSVHLSIVDIEYFRTNT